MRKTVVLSVLTYVMALPFYGSTMEDDLEKYVNTLIGTSVSVTKNVGVYGQKTENYGQVIPAVFVPHGMNFWTPQTQDTELKCVAPYYYKDNHLQGFRNSHWIVGGCTQDYGSMTLMSVTGALKTQPKDRQSSFAHHNEVTTPSYYSTYLDDYKTKAEMTAQSRSAIFRFTYDEDDKAFLIVNPNSDEGEGFVEIDLQRKEIRGYNPVHRIYQGWGERAGYSGYFVVKFQGEPVSYGVYCDDDVYEGRASIGRKEKIGAFVGFKVKRGTELLVKAGSSFVSMQGAEKNMEKEIPGWSFDEVRARLHRCWNEHLSTISVSDSRYDKDLRTMFYSAYYRSSFLPHAINDVDGSYPQFAGGKSVMKMESGDYYDDYSTWDTYRAQHPLMTITNPKMTGEIVNSLILKYEQGGWLPIFPCWNSYTSAMIGDHCISVIGDAVIKGIGGFDVTKAYEAMRKNAFEIPENADEYKGGKGRRALRSYLKYGYIPLEDPVMEAFHTKEQVSRTLEYAYDDYVLAAVAKKLNKADDCRLLAKRAMNYRNVIDPSTGYAQGRHRDGTFLKDDNKNSFVKFITEGAPCHYTWYVPHDIAGLMKIMGGRTAFSTKLDSMFIQNRYWHGNEPCHQVAYLYDYCGEAWKTQRQVRKILHDEYMNAPGGLSGNDDAGQMSAWYVFSAIGFYPVCPGNPVYVIGTPSFDNVTFNLKNGKTFNIEAENLSERNFYIQKAYLNGKELKRSYVRHSELMNGGTLRFVMGDRPNKQLWHKESSYPPSVSKY